MNAMLQTLATDDPVARMTAQLLRSASGSHNDAALARIVAAQRLGHSCLPLHLGLDLNAFGALMRRHFPGALFWLALHSSHAQAFERGALREQLLRMRGDEFSDVRDLLLAGRRGESETEIWLASIIAAGCLGGEHLWRDLGLVSRVQLGELLRHNFPGTALRNDRDMKWKKFFYRELCAHGGHFVCRSPSCEQCGAYEDCFGPEQ